MSADHELGTGDLFAKYRASWPEASFLARLDPSALAAIAAGKPRVRYATDDELMTEGDTGSDVFLLLSGVVKVTARLDPGTALLAVRVGGDILGEIAAADGGVRSATVTATRLETIAIQVPAADFAAAMDRYPAAARLLAATLSRKLRAADRRRVDFTRYPVPVRVARVLAEMAQEYGQRSERKPAECVLRVGLTQVELATLAGAREASVSAALKQLRLDGVLASSYLYLTILDMDALLARARLSRPGRPPARIP